MNLGKGEYISDRTIALPVLPKKGVHKGKWERRGG